MLSSANTIVAGRSCSSCTMCCKLLGIEALAKPRLAWCPNCDVGNGCKIYAQRPSECAAFHCAWLLNADLGEAWRPAACRMILTFEAAANRVVIHVDHTRGDTWRKAPYYRQIKHMAAQALRSCGQLLVWQGREAIVVLPDRDVNLGVVHADKVIVVSETRSPLGVSYDVAAFDADDSRAGQ